MVSIPENPVILRKRSRFLLVPSQPFHFFGTIRKASHFPSPTELFYGEALRFTMRTGGQLLGVVIKHHRLNENDCMDVTLYARDAISESEREAAAEEIRWRFDLDADISSFLSMANRDPVLRKVTRRWAGMRVQSKESFSDLLTISIVLQNATVRRSVQMLNNLLRTFGLRVRFDGHEIYSFWPATRLADEPEERLRAMKLGYRAKTFIRVSSDLKDSRYEEARLRKLSRPELRERLLELYGIGPASVGILMFELFHHYDQLDHISPWEQQIYSQLLFGEPLVPVTRIFGRIECWRPWRMLSMHYLFEDLFWQHNASPIPWLAKLIRL